MHRWLSMVGIVWVAVCLLYIADVNAEKVGKVTRRRLGGLPKTCAQPNGPIHGVIKECQPSSSIIKCKVVCDNGYWFQDGSEEKQISCVYNEDKWIPDVPECISKLYVRGSHDVPPDFSVGSSHSSMGRVGSSHNSMGTVSLSHNSMGTVGSSRNSMGAVGSSRNSMGTGLCQIQKPKNALHVNCKHDHLMMNCTGTCLNGYKFMNGRQEEVITCIRKTGIWSPTNSFTACEPICEKGCQNGGKCVIPNYCKCPDKFRGDSCQFPISNCNISQFGFDIHRCKHSPTETICNVYCPAGKVLNRPDSATLRCTPDGRWTPSVLPRCVEGDTAGNTLNTGLCQKPDFPTPGSLQCSYNSIVMNCTGTCSKGYQFLDGRKQNVITCIMKTGIWSPSSNFTACEPICEKECQNGGKCIFPNMCKCSPGFQGDSCEFQTNIRCPDPQAPEFSDMKCRDIESGRRCDVRCKSGYVLLPGRLSFFMTECFPHSNTWYPSPAGVRCEREGHFGNSNLDYRKACGNPASSEGVRIDCGDSKITDSNRECKGTCVGNEKYKKYFADGQFTHSRNCKNGIWLEGKEFPPCKRKSGSTSSHSLDLCNIPSRPINGIMNCSNTRTDKICVAFCKTGYHFRHGGLHETVTCKLSQGNWSPKSVFSDCILTCNPVCEHGGRCIENGTCLCPEEYRGRQCQYSKSNCDENKIPFSGSVTCKHLPDRSICELKCPTGYQLDALINKVMCDMRGNLSPSIIPKCQSLLTGDSESISGSVNHTGKGWPPDVESMSGYYWKDESGNKRQFKLATSESTGVCAVWSTHHYRTFDGYIYDYAGSCSYMLAKDYLTDIFSIILEYDKDCVNSRIRSRTKCYHTVKIKLADAAYDLYAGSDGVILSKDGKALSIPYTEGISVEYIGRYVVATLYQDTTVWIDGKDTIYIIAGERFKNGLAGLCGNYDNNYSNDMMTPGGTLVNSVITFGNTWKVEEAGVCEDVIENVYSATCRHDSTSNDRIAEKAAARCLSINEYKYCHEFVNPEIYIEACKIDCCNQDGQQGCECSSFAEYFRECTRLYSRKYTAWRKPALCPVKCENGTQYQDCGSACPKICGAPEIPCTIKTCVDGCHCPEGMAFHEKQCVPINECPCQHVDRWYAHGASLEINCRKCLCQGGNWECTENICPAICSSVGDSHFTTFDGKRYNFVGQCSYYLVHQDDGYFVEQENSNCVGDTSEYARASHKEPVISCKKTIILKTPQGTIVKLKHGMEVSVNGKEVVSLPHLAPGVSVRQLTSLYQEAEFSNGLKIIWDGWKRIYVIAPPVLFGKVQGLCGTFNNFQNDDFVTPAGDQEKSVNFFAEKWKVPNGCHAGLSHNMISSPCDNFDNFQKEAENFCSVIKSEIFKDCTAVIDPEPFYKNCMDDICSCKSEISSCFCSSLANYAFICARNNVSIDWRLHVPNCGLRCIGQQQYQISSKSCEYSCRQIAMLPECDREHVEGCACPSSETLDTNGNCIPTSECPCIYHNHEYPREFIQRRGTERCQCLRGRWLCRNSSLEELLVTSPPEVPTCLASDHKEYTDCTSQCPVTCSNLHDPPTCQMEECKTGCRCQQGYVLNEDTDVCVRPKDCPCHHGKRSYKDKEKIYIDCKECVCRKGFWACETTSCPGVCSSWGNSHFMTFDGHFYDFQGTCEYVLASAVTDGNEDFSITIQNEKCGSNGITCSKMIVFSLGDDRITFSNNGPLPSVNQNSPFSIKEVGLFVYVTTNIGISLHWDKGTRVYVHASATWQQRLRGLCGDFNGDSRDDFKQPSGNIPVTRAVDFADSWKMHPYCKKPIDVPNACVYHSERRDWALRKCKVLKSSLFSDCHSEVELQPYYESCVFDTCACDMGGDCECLCTAIAAYAYECARNGIYVYWRSQELCPIQCEECDHYSPCVSICPLETCETLEDKQSLAKACGKEPCSEGCEKNTCPPGQVYNNTEDHKCIPRNECIVFEPPLLCKNINGRDYKNGELIDDPEYTNECRKCYCLREQPQCTNHSCVTTQEYTEISELCKPGWSQWLNFSSSDFKETFHSMCPVSDVTEVECRPNDNECSLENAISCLNGDYQETQLCSKYEIRIYCSCADYEEPSEDHTEELPSLETGTKYPPVACGLPMYTDWMMISIPKVETLPELTSKLRESYTFCGDADILSVECDNSPNQRITHNKKKNKYIKNCIDTLPCGLNTKLKKPCKVRILCNCVIKNLQLPNVTCLNSTPWINFDRPDDGIDFESLHRIPAVTKLCPKITSTHCKELPRNLSKPPPVSDYNIRCTGGEVACKTDSKHTCPDYIIKSSCKCSKKPPRPKPQTTITTTKITLSTAVCPPGLAWDDCAIDCEQTCKPFREQLSQRGKCTKKSHCVAGCRPFECLRPKVWSDEYTCILENECPCITKNGKLVGPEGVVKVNDCEICQCLNNNLHCTQMAKCIDEYKELKNYSGENIVGDDCWTRWINSDSPSSGAGDFEKLSILQQMFNFCSNPKEVQCRDAITKKDAKDSNQDVTCDKVKGLSCWNNRTRCNDYEIRFFCPCPAATSFSEPEITTTAAPQFCKQGWSVWFDSHKTDDLGDYDNLQVVEQNIGNKLCYSGTVASVKCRRKYDNISYDLTNQYVTCDAEKGLLCENSKQIKGERCDDYEISFFCDCFDQTAPETISSSSYGFFSTQQTIFEKVSEVVKLPFITPVPTVAFACVEFESLINGPRKLPDINFKASSRRSSEYDADNIIISTKYKHDSGKAWIPAALNKNQYVEIDLPEPHLIYGIITQGRGDYQEWVSSFYISYSSDGYSFAKYKDPRSSEEVMSGNYDSTSLVKILFNAPFEAKYIRIHPFTWEGQIALRAELLGCSKTDNTTEAQKTSVCLEPMGLENGKMSDAQMTAPSQHDWSHTPSDGRLGGSSWVAGVSDDKQYLQIDFFEKRILSAIVTQGREKENQWVSAYKVTYSNDGRTWTTVSEDQKDKIFPGNYDGKNLVINYLPRTLRTRYLRIIPVEWKNWISMKLEILGCYHPYPEVPSTTVLEIIYALPTVKATLSSSCLQPMGLSSTVYGAEESLPDNLITVSSSEPGADSSRIRLGTKAEGNMKGGWIPKPQDKTPSVTIDFLIPSILTSITTKGIEGTRRWVNSYKVYVSNDTSDWQPVYSERSAIFEGNTDDTNEINNMFDTPVMARYFKLEIIGSENSHPGLRMEVFGCSHPYETLSTIPMIPPSDLEEKGLLPVTTPGGLEEEESCIKYGHWKSLSNPNLPGSEGDFENIKEVIAVSRLCVNPIDIECRTYATHTNYKQTGENVACDLTNGLSCWNKNQRDGRCDNYEVRIKCWTCPWETSNTTVVPGVLLCPELPRHMAKNCPVCPKKLICNGTSCIDETDCPCVSGNKVFQIGHTITTSKCEECQCTLGGHSLCSNKSCEQCLPEQRPELHSDCSCSCESCQQGEKMCITNKVCIQESKWCDGIEDCPDDEINCATIPSSLPEITTLPSTEFEAGTCELLGKRIRTVDGQELDYEVCDHTVFMDDLTKNFNVTVKKNCSQNPVVCRKIYLIQQDETSVVIDDDVKVTINGNKYTASQLTVFNKQSSNITVEIVGNHVIVKSKIYNVTIKRDQRANLRAEISPKMKNRALGLCGLYNGKAFDDKRKPDGTIAVTSKEFGDSWSNSDPSKCVISNCSTEFVEKSMEICKKLREDPFDICKDYLNVESYVQACITSTCDCMMENVSKISECKCAAFLPLLEACENKVHHSLSKWRTKYGCAPTCAAGLVWEDCGSGCQLTCGSIDMQEQACLETCVPGCFCPAGTVLDGEKCILPEECSNAQCQGFGDPHFSTFDGLYYPFQAVGQFVLATDKENTFSIEGKSGKCSQQGNGTCLSALSITYRNIIVKIIKGKPITIDDKPINMEMLPLELNGVVVLGFPGEIYLVIIPTLSIVVRYYGINDGFSINIPSERFNNKTRGLCGNCNGKQNDEMVPAYDMIINSTGDFVCSWVKDETFTQCKTSFHEKTIINLEDKCPEIFDRTFSSCHLLVDPALYQQSCSYDVTYSTDRHNAVCKTLMEYAKQCCEAGIVLSEWFVKYNCVIPCPNGTVYHHCHDACPQTCQKSSKTVDCHNLKVDGCFCPENKVLKDGICVDELYCKLPTGCTYTMQYEVDSEGNEILLSPDKQNSSFFKVGETWQDGLCLNCTCKENSGQHFPYCSATECPDYKNSTENLDYEILSHRVPGECCPKIFHAKCKDEDGNLKPVGEKWQSKTNSCKEFECAVSSEGYASKITKDVKCGCDEDEEEQTPDENHCCGKCVKKYCRYENKLYPVGKQLKIGCYIVECAEENGKPTVIKNKNCSQIPDSCPQEHIVWDKDNCCQICNTTVGAIGCNTIHTDLKPGEFEQEYNNHGKCINDKPLSAVIKCAGICKSESMYYLENGEVASSCKCCSPVNIKVREIELVCEDNTRQTFRLKQPETCKCSPCAASAKNKNTNYTSGETGSNTKNLYEKYSALNTESESEQDIQGRNEAEVYEKESNRETAKNLSPLVSEV